MILKVTDYGARITSIVVPDRDGKLADVALGFREPASYVNAADEPYFGATVGRCANRIAWGRFHLDGEEYSLATNAGKHHFHAESLLSIKLFGHSKQVIFKMPLSSAMRLKMERRAIQAACACPSAISGHRTAFRACACAR